MNRANANTGAQAKRRASTRTSTVAATATLLAGLCALLVGRRVLDADATGTAVTYLALCALLAAGALRVVTLLGATGDARKVEQRLLVSYLGVFVSVGLYFASTADGLSSLGLSSEEPGNAGEVLTVAWMVGMTLSLFAILFTELVYLRMPVPQSVELRRVRSSLHAGLSLGLSLVFLLAINYIATARDVRRDVTYFKTTSPSDSTLAMLDRLDRPVRAVLFFEPASDVLTQLEPYFAALSSSGERFSYEVSDVALLPELSQQHKVRRNGTVLLLQPDDGEKDDGGPEQGAEAASRRSEGEGSDDEPGRDRSELLEVGSTLTEARARLRKLDGVFQEGFRKLVQPERAVLLTVGHGEHNEKRGDPEPGDGTAFMQQVLTRLNLKSEALGIGGGLGKAVPDGASAVVVVGPSEPFLPEEVTTLLSYVKRGGRLLLMLDPDSDVGLDELYEGLGVKVLPGTVVSPSRHMRKAFNQSDRAIVYTNSYTSHPSVTTASRHAREVATVFYRGTAFARAKREQPREEGPQVTFPIRSGPDFFRDLDGDYELGDGEQAGVQMLVAAVSIEAEGGKEGRVVIVGDGDFITDKLSRSSGNVLVFVDSLAWLVGNEELGGEVESEEDVRIEHSREQDKIWFYGTTFAVPAPVLALGVWIARRRRRRSEAAS